MQPDSTSTLPALEKTDFLWLVALILVGLFALSLRVYYVNTTVVPQPLRGDAREYFTYAWNLVHHGTFSKAALNGTAFPAPDNYRDPGYPLLLAICLKATSNLPTWYALVLFIQALLGALTVVLLMSASRRWIPDRWLIAAGVLMAAWPHSVTLTGYVLSETLFGFLCALAIFCLARAAGRSHVLWAAAAGLAFGAASLTNAILLPFGPLLACLLAWRGGTRRRVLIALGGSAVLLPLAWGIRNMQLPPGDSASGRAVINLVQGSWPEYHSIWFKMSNGDTQARQTMRTLENEFHVLQANPAAGLQLMSARMRTDPVRYLGWYLSKPALLWGWNIRVGIGDIYVYPILGSPFDSQPPLRVWAALCHALNRFLMLLALGGCFMQFWRKETTSYVGPTLAAAALYVTLVYSVLQSEPRYSVPFRGMEILLATSSLWALSRWLAARRRPAVQSDRQTVQ